MPGKNVLRTIGILSVCQGCALVTLRFNENNPRGDSVRRYCSRIEALCMEAHQEWKADLSVGDLKWIHTEFQKLERAGVDGYEKADVSRMTSLCLALLDDLLPHIKDGRRRRVLEKLETAMGQLHRHYDRRLDRAEDYAAAERASREWA